MTTLWPAIVLFATYFLLASAERSDESISNPVFLAPAIELKRIPKPVLSDISPSESVAREQRVLPEPRHDTSDGFDSVSNSLNARSDSAVSNNGIGPKKPSKKTGQTSNKSGGYGYPYRMAPTLPPFLKHISDRHDDEPEAKSGVAPKRIVPSRPKMPAMPHMPPMPKMSTGGGGSPKHPDTLEKRQGFSYDRDSSEEFGYSSYQEPKYRNTYDLDEFSPRRMYYESQGSYNRPAFKFPTLKPTPAVSPRDPYLSPSSEPIDGFYPKVKNNGVSTSYSSYGKRDKYYKSVEEEDPVPPPPPPRDYNGDDDFSDFSSEEDDDYKGSYGKGPKYSEPDPYPPPPEKEPGSYDALYNSPIIGITRKRLLDYAGASDLYEGEPDYLKSAAIRKTKFGSIQHDYIPYRRSDSYDFTDYQADGSRRTASRVKRQATQQEEIVPKCSRNNSLSMCLTDEDYPTDEVRKIILKNMKFLSELRNTRLEMNEKKSTERDPESLEHLEKTRSVCSSKKGFLFPKRAKDDDGLWRTVINIENVKQSIKVDVCRSPEAPCDYVPATIATKCIQKFSSVTLITFNEENNTLEDHDFPVPSACSCSVGKPTRVFLE